MREEWKSVPGYEDCYAVSDRGRVKRLPSGRLLTVRLKRGYVAYSLCRNGIVKEPYIHRVMWEAFNGPIPAGLEINHLNGKRADNRLCNLELCTRSQNIQHAFRVLGRALPNNQKHGSEHHFAKLSEADIPKIIAMYGTGKYYQRQVAKKFGVSQMTISLVTRRVRWRHVNPAI